MADGSVIYLLDEEAAGEVRRNEGELLERLGEALQVPVLVVGASPTVEQLIPSLNLWLSYAGVIHLGGRRLVRGPRCQWFESGPTPSRGSCPALSRVTGARCYRSFYSTIPASSWCQARARLCLLGLFWG